MPSSDGAASAGRPWRRCWRRCWRRPMRYSTVTSASATCPLVGRYCVCHVCIDYFLFGQCREIENLQQPLDMRSKKCRVRKARGEEGGKIREELAGTLQARCLVFTTGGHRNRRYLYHTKQFCNFLFLISFFFPSGPMTQTIPCCLW